MYAIRSYYGILANPAFRKSKEAFHGLVTNLTDSLLVQAEEKKK